MKLVIAGSRSISATAALRVLGEQWPSMPDLRWWRKPTHIISGGAPGVDRAAEVWARRLGIQPDVYLADWSRLGNRAGAIRNAEMAQLGDALIAIWDGKSNGTKHMIAAMRQAGKPIEVIDGPPPAQLAMPGFDRLPRR